MFSSTTTGKRWVWAFVDLIVVIIGVYVAFLIQNEASKRKDQKEKIKIYSALKMELETMRVAFPLFAQSNFDFLDKIKSQESVDISGWRFIEPQYGYQIIEYAITNENTEIINFEVYNELQGLYVGIKQLEHTERLITEVAGDYQYLIPELSNDHPLNLERATNNQLRISRFKVFLRGRAENLLRTSGKTKPLLNAINKELGSEKSLEIDRKFIAETIGWIQSEEKVIKLVQEHFPHISKDEIIEMYRQIKGNTQSNDKNE